MFKTVIASVAVASALLVGCTATAPEARTEPARAPVPAAPQSDPLTDAINEQAHIPGMVDLLNVFRAEGVLTQPYEVSEAVYLGQHYCNPTQWDLDWFEVSTADEYRDYIDTQYIDALLPPANATRVKDALAAFCARP